MRREYPAGGRGETGGAGAGRRVAGRGAAAGCRLAARGRAAGRWLAPRGPVAGKLSPGAADRRPGSAEVADQPPRSGGRRGVAKVRHLPAGARHASVRRSSRFRELRAEGVSLPRAVAGTTRSAVPYGGHAAIRNSGRAARPRGGPGRRRKAHGGVGSCAFGVLLHGSVRVLSPPLTGQVPATKIGAPMAPQCAARPPGRRDRVTEACRRFPARFGAVLSPDPAGTTRHVFVPK
jgi:hypothetical protein